MPICLSAFRRLLRRGAFLSTFPAYSLRTAQVASQPKNHQRWRQSDYQGRRPPRQRTHYPSYLPAQSGHSGRWRVPLYIPLISRAKSSCHCCAHPPTRLDKSHAQNLGVTPEFPKNLNLERNDVFLRCGDGVFGASLVGYTEFNLKSVVF